MRRIECTISRSNCELSTIGLVPAITYESTISTYVKSNNDAYVSDKFFTIKTNCLKNNLALSQYYIQLQIQQLIYIDMAVKKNYQFYRTMLQKTEQFIFQNRTEQLDQQKLSFYKYYILGIL